MIFGQILYGLYYLYCEKRIIHRDLKPENILLQYNENDTNDLIIVKICDFGFARSFCDKMGTTAGTRTEVCKSILDGELYDETCDLYSIACVLYFLLNSKRMFKKDITQSELVDKVKKREYPESNTRNSEEGETIAKLIDAILNPKDEKSKMTWASLRNNEYVIDCFEYVMKEYDLDNDYFYDFYEEDDVDNNEEDEEE